MALLIRKYILLFVFCTVTKHVESWQTLRPSQENGIRYDVEVCNEFEVELVFELEGQEIGVNDSKQVNVFHYEDDNQQLKHQLSSEPSDCHHGYCIDLVYCGNMMNVTFKIVHVIPMDRGDYKVDVRLVSDRNIIFAQGSGTFELLVEEGDQIDKQTGDCIGDNHDKTTSPASKGTEQVNATSTGALTSKGSGRGNLASSTPPTPTDTEQFKSMLLEILAVVAFIFCSIFGVVIFLLCLKKRRRSEQTTTGGNSDVSRLVAIFTGGGHVTGHVQMSIAMQSNMASTWV
ncbi:uncharacterized protein [Ptychodera flava]|uniref:uncharacterized protein n=1 Tax=Ptychodera flava TaxID=63121 RepID=UPI003969F7BA